MLTGWGFSLENFEILDRRDPRAEGAEGAEGQVEGE